MLWSEIYRFGLYSEDLFFQLEDNLFLWGLEPVDYIFLGDIGFFQFHLDFQFAVHPKAKRTETTD